MDDDVSLSRDRSRSRPRGLALPAATADLAAIQELRKVLYVFPSGLPLNRLRVEARWGQGVLRMDMPLLTFLERYPDVFVTSAEFQCTCVRLHTQPSGSGIDNAKKPDR